MTMNLILLEKPDFIDESTACIKGPRTKHIHQYFNPEPGMELKAGLLNGMKGRALVKEISPVSIVLETFFDEKPPSKIPLTLLLAMPRPKAFKRILICIASMGIEELIVIKTWKVEKNYFQSPVLEPEAIQKHLKLGLEQAGDTFLPEVKIRELFKPFVEDELPGILENKALFTAHPYSDEPCPVALNSPALIVIGPEGGFIPYEIEKLESLGFKTVNMGQRILKVEHAVPALVGRLYQ